ncbi:MAG: transglutaminase family protein [Desulfobacterales bacterium]
MEVNIHRPIPGKRWWKPPPNCMKKPGRPAWGRKNSCSTAVTAAPAAAIILLWEVPHRGSPWLKRPDLLRSFLTYWNNHPSLSFLFRAVCRAHQSGAPH